MLAIEVPTVGPNKKKKQKESLKNKIEEGQRKKLVNVKINGQTVKLLLDSGCDISVINEQTWKKIVCSPLTNIDKIKKDLSFEVN